MLSNVITYPSKGHDNHIKSTNRYRYPHWQHRHRSPCWTYQPRLPSSPHIPLRRRNSMSMSSTTQTRRNRILGRQKLSKPSQEDPRARVMSAAAGETSNEEIAGAYGLATSSPYRVIARLAIMVSVTLSWQHMDTICCPPGFGIKSRSKNVSVKKAT